MTNFTARISSIAMLAMAALPAVALATAAHADTVVKVADINVLTPQGLAAFDQRADAAARAYCLPERGIAARNSCRAGVKLELSEKLADLRNARFAQASQSLAAR